MIYTGTYQLIKPFHCAVHVCTCYVGQTRMPFEKQIKQFLLGVLRCVTICCRKCLIEARKVTAEAGTAAGAFAGEVYSNLYCTFMPSAHYNT